MRSRPPLRTRVLLRFAAPIPCALVALLIACPAAFAHGPLHAEIASLTSEIAAHPADPALYMERAERWRLDGSFEAAAADLDRAEVLAPQLVRLALLRGQLALDAGDLAAAEAQLDRYVSLAPEDPRGFEMRSRVLSAGRRPVEAANDLSRALALSAAPVPDWALERARLRVASGAPELALRELDALLAQSGSLVSLERAALDLERSLGRIDAALARLERVGPHWGAPHQVHLERAELFEHSGRRLDACAELSEALLLLESEPESRRATPAHRDLESRVRERLAALQPEVAVR